MSTMTVFSLISSNYDVCSESSMVNSAPMGPVTGYELYVIRKKGMLWGYFFFV
jgi:hypothetical protein